MSRHRFALKNCTRAARTLIVEPWCEHVAMPPGTRVTLEFVGPAGEMEVEFEDFVVVVYGWEGVTFRVVDIESQPSKGK